MDFTAGWQALLTAFIAVAGIIATVVATQLTARAGDRRAVKDREAAAALARFERTENRTDARAQHDRAVEDSERVERRELLRQLLQAVQPFLMNNSLEYQRLGEDERKPWLQEKVAYVLVLAYEVGDPAIIASARALNGTAFQYDFDPKPMLAIEMGSMHDLAARCGELLNARVTIAREPASS